ncbi:retrovirus-related pol polyprotein from transposon TNT 1-94 [Tanacetum coccineum]
MGNEPTRFSQLITDPNWRNAIDKEIDTLKKNGIKITCQPEGLFLSQRKYALDILSKSDLLGSKPCDFPIELNHQLALASRLDFNQPDHYRRLSPKDAHWNVALRVLHYLKGHPGQDALLRANLSCWACLQFHGRLRSNLRSLDHLPKLSIGQWLQLVTNLHG